MEREKGKYRRVPALKDETNGLVLLRRADWRFLLKNPHPQRSVCFADDQLSYAVRLISQETVSPDKVIPGSCDLAVVSNPTRETLQAAWKSLKPGGMLYGEWYSPLRGGSPRIRSQVETAGFENVDSYWPWPLPGRGSTLFWLPIDVPATLDYFLRSRPPSRSLKEGFIRSILRTVWKIARRTRLLVPVCVTASKPDISSSPSRYKEGDLLQVVMDGWQEWGLGPSPDSIHWLMLTGGHRRINKVVKLVFSSSEPAPCLVVKHARVPETIPSLAREADNLRSLALLPDGGPRNVPRLLSLQPMRGSLALVETVVEGHPLVTILTKENYRSLALKATDWLGQLVRRETNLPRQEWWPRVAGPVLASFERKYGGELGGMIAREIRDNLRPLGTLPGAFEHRDFSAWNVLVSAGGEVSVLDWDAGEPDGLPGLDLVFFLTTLALLHEGAMSTGHYRPAYRAAQNPNSFTGSVQAECLRVYFETLHLHPDLARPLRILAWAYHSLSTLPRIGSQENPSGSKQSNPFIQLLFEELGVD